MKNIQQDKLSVTRTAQVYTYGHKVNAKVAVIVCHGYAHLANRIIQKFNNLNEDDIYVVAPQGLSVFYWKGMNEDPVASWMTSKDRLDEIEDFSNYLSTVYQHYLSDFSGKIVLMGFSQGCATVWRWQKKYPVQYNCMINWSGWIPEDIDLSNALDHLSSPKVHVVVGNQDQYLTEERIVEMKKVISRNNIPAIHHRFEGKHQVDRRLLESILKSIIDE